MNDHQSVRVPAEVAAEITPSCGRARSLIHGLFHSVWILLRFQSRESYAQAGFWLLVGWVILIVSPRDPTQVGINPAHGAMTLFHALALAALLGRPSEWFEESQVAVMPRRRSVGIAASLLVTAGIWTVDAVIIGLRGDDLASWCVLSFLWVAPLWLRVVGFSPGWRLPVLGFCLGLMAINTTVSDGASAREILPAPRHVLAVLTIPMLLHLIWLIRQPTGPTSTWGRTWLPVETIGGRGWWGRWRLDGWAIQRVTGGLSLALEVAGMLVWRSVAFTLAAVLLGYFAGHGPIFALLVSSYLGLLSWPENSASGQSHLSWVTGMRQRPIQWDTAIGWALAAHFILLVAIPTLGWHLGADLFRQLPPFWAPSPPPSLTWSLPDSLIRGFCFGAMTWGWYPLIRWDRDHRVVIRSLVILLMPWFLFVGQLPVPTWILALMTALFLVGVWWNWTRIEPARRTSDSTTRTT